MKQATRGNAWQGDAELVAGILGGSREHFDRLYETYFDRVYRFAMKRLGDPAEAESVTQEIFIAICMALPSYTGKSALRAWILVITRNKVNRRLSSGRRR